MNKQEFNGYELSRKWFDFCFENPEQIKPNHTALYFFCIEHCNRLGWKQKFGLPTTMAKEAIGIRSYNTYINTLNDLVDWGFIEMIEKSKNQYSSNIIALSNFNKALNKALDKALIKHTTKQRESTRQSIDSIDKQENKKQENKEQRTILLSDAKRTDVKISDVEYLEIAQAFQKLFIHNIKSGGGSTRQIENAKLKTWISPIRLMITADGISVQNIKKVGDFLTRDDFWKQNILSTAKLRKQFNQLILKANGNTKNKSAVSKEFIERIFTRN